MEQSDAILEAAYIQAAATLVAAKIADAAARKLDRIPTESLAGEIEAAITSVKAGLKMRRQARKTAAGKNEQPAAT